MSLRDWAATPATRSAAAIKERILVDFGGFGVGVAKGDLIRTNVLKKNRGQVHLELRAI